MLEKLIKMFSLQEELNEKINQNWRSERTKEDFARAIWIECAELIDSLPWKWWKKMEADFDNVNVEIVDIYHFIMSYTLLDVKKVEDVVNTKDVGYFLKGLKEDFKDIDIDGDHINHYLWETDKIKRLIFLAERIAEYYLRQISYAGNLFFGLLVKNSIDFNKFFLLYMGKNILNHIRQEEGYNKGNYKKVINGLEDNKYLLQIVKNINSEKELENLLREEFKKLRKEG